MIRSVNLFWKTAWLFAGLLIFFSGNISAQTAYPDYSLVTYDSLFYEQFSSHKKIPTAYRRQILMALAHYPELKETRIVFRMKTRVVPLATAPAFFSSFRKKEKRKFKVTISRQSIKLIRPILLKNLSLNAQIGVIGHELAHVSDFSTRSFRRLAGVLTGQLSRKYLDQMEFNTDKRCIEHGLGFQLLAWSSEVRTKLSFLAKKETSHPENKQKEKKRERYMSPASIQKVMSELDVYAQ